MSPKVSRLIGYQSREKKNMYAMAVPAMTLIRLSGEKNSHYLNPIPDIAETLMSPKQIKILEYQ